MHRLVKRLHGSTNKRNADWRVAKRYRRHERARLAHEHKQLRERATKSRTVGQDDWSETTVDELINGTIFLCLFAKQALIVSIQGCHHVIAISMVPKIQFSSMAS